MKQFILILLMLVSYISVAQPPTKFYCRYGGSGYDVGYDVKQTLDGGYIITGSTSSFGQGNTDMYLLKLDSMGQVKFQKTFGGVSNETGKSIVQLLDSSFAMVGYTSSSGVGGYDMFLVKTDKAGNLLWQKTIGGEDWDFANSLQATADGGFIIGGTTYSYGNGNADGYVVKTDANGDTLWTRTYGGTNDDEFKSVIQTADGNYALTGYTKSYNDVDSGDVWVFKLDMNGDSLWCKFYGGSNEDFARGIIQLQNSTILVSGGTRSQSSTGYAETLIITYDNISGNQVYDYRDVSSHEEYYNGVAQSVNGSIANCGTTKNSVFGYDGLIDIYSNTYGLVNFFSEGTIMYEEFFGISTTRDKGFVAVGKTTGYNSILDDVFFMKVDSLGSFGTSIVSIKENESIEEYRIYPNPATGYFTIDIPTNNTRDEFYCNLVDINGQTISSQNLNSSKNRIETSEFSSGLYFVQIYNSKGLAKTQKISIVR